MVVVANSNAIDPKNYKKPKVSRIPRLPKMDLNVNRLQISNSASIIISVRKSQSRFKQLSNQQSEF